MHGCGLCFCVVDSLADDSELPMKSIGVDERDIPSLSQLLRLERFEFAYVLKQC